MPHGPHPHAPCSQTPSMRSVTSHYRGKGQLIWHNLGLTSLTMIRGKGGSCYSRHLITRVPCSLREAPTTTNGGEEESNNNGDGTISLHKVGNALHSIAFRAKARIRWVDYSCRRRVFKQLQIPLKNSSNCEQNNRTRNSIQGSQPREPGTLCEKGSPTRKGGGGRV